MLVHIAGSAATEIFPQLLEISELRGIELHGDLSPAGNSAISDAVAGTKRILSLKQFVGHEVQGATDRPRCHPRVGFARLYEKTP